ncbi:MAG: transporter substrate-binding domain-containing protein [Alphaproteobacteria bacterium]|nr:transporter substrate-binding domain-containing protein [Alphaproteobacteria bacterium]
MIRLSRRAAVAGAFATISAPAALRAQTLRKTSVGVLRLSSSGPVFIAAERGYWREAGLDVELKFFTAAQQVPVAVTSGDAEFGVTGLTASFFNLAGKGALKIIASQSREAKGFPLVAYMVTNAAYDKGFRSVRDFAGKRVGITTTGSTFHYELGLLAKKYGFELSSVTLVPLQTLPNMQAAFKGGQVDAILAPVTLARALTADNSGKVLAWAGDETPWQLGALFTSPRAIAERRDLVERFVRGYLRGTADFNAAFNQRDAAGKEVHGTNFAETIGVVARAVQQSPELVAVGLPFVDALGRLDVGDIYNQIAFWQQAGLVGRDVNGREIVDLSFVRGHLNVPKS